MDLTQALNEISAMSKDSGMRYAGKLLLLSEILGLEVSEIVADKDRELTQEQEHKLWFYLRELFINGKPLEKISCRAYFYGREFYVDENVLSPRDDTELLVEKTLEYISEDNPKSFRILEIGAGSGCVAVTLAAENPAIIVVAADISIKALEIAEKNICRYLPKDRVKLILSDIYDNIPEEVFDIIISNPPYITDSEYDLLGRGVKEHDPEIALRGGPDGLIFYRRIINGADRFLKEGGAVFFETGRDISGAVSKLMEEKFEEISVFRDHGGNDRVICGRKKRMEK